MKSYLFASMFAVLLFWGVAAEAGKDPFINLGTEKPTSIQIGDSITIFWTSIDAKRVISSATGGKSLELSGSMTLKPTVTTTYEFTAIRGSKTKTKKITIEVLEPSFTKLTVPEYVSDEETSSFSWEAANAEYVLIKGFDDAFETSGKFPLKTQKDTTIELTAVNKFGHSRTKKIKIKVKYVEKLDFTKRIPVGNPAQISWSFKNCEKVKLAGIADNLPVSGEINFQLNKTTDFSMLIYRNNGVLEFKDFTIQVYKSEIKYFMSLEKVFPGDEAVLSWQVLNADSVKLSVSDELQPLAGKFKYKPTETEYVTLFSYLNGMNDTAETRVELVKRKYITGEKDFTQITKGIRLDYEIFGVDLSEYPQYIKLFVLVVDENGNFVHGLAPPTISAGESRKYFNGLVETYTGGGTNSINDFSVVENTDDKKNDSDIAVVLDYSGSMTSTIQDLEVATKSFISNKRDNDRISLVRFDSKVVPEIGLTQNKQIILNSIKFEGLNNYGGSTALYAGMSDGLSSLKDEPNRTKEMIVFTDGFENSSMFYYGQKAVTAQELANLANKDNVRINIISFGECVNSKLLETMAGYTGGNYYPVSTSKEVSGVWYELPYLKRNYYIVKFKSSDIKKINGIKLSYNDNTGKVYTVGKKLYLNEDIDFNKFEADTSSYWIKHLGKITNKTALSAPQVIALFSLNGTVVMDEYLPKIDSLVSFMQSDTAISIAIFGHTDLTDTEEYNKALSERRCNFVKSYLIKAGIAENRIISVPLGELYPIWKEEKKDWQAQENRRIEIVMMK
jgi:outer membrane protein OmpA-like peptidoglycan-associated protein/Mg-chelatase subunit ChlD